MDDGRVERARDLLDELCTRFPDRHVGGPGNLAATRLFAERTSAAGLEVEIHVFDCLDWEAGEASLEVGDRTWPLQVGPYSLPCEAHARLVAVDSAAALAAEDIRDAIVLVHGELVRDQMTPKNYPFYSFEEHTRILALLEEGEPFALVAATGRCPMTAALDPFPWIEDGDFDVPHAFLKESEVAALVERAGQQAVVRIGSRRFAATAEQVIARRPGRGAGRVLVTAHIDSRHGTPGALDNATGVAVLLALAESLGADGNGRTVELVPFNGEDNYAAPGQQEYLRLNEGALGDIALVVNLDAAAHVGQRTAVSFYGCPADVEASLRAALESRDGFFEGPQWVQGDHSIFAFRGIPAMAITSESLGQIAATVAHTERDTPELADPATVVAIASFIADALEALPA